MRKDHFLRKEGLGRETVEGALWKDEPAYTGVEEETEDIDVEHWEWGDFFRYESALDGRFVTPEFLLDVVDSCLWLSRVFFFVRPPKSGFWPSGSDWDESSNKSFKLFVVDSTAALCLSPLDALSD
ncbi:hypothetical protein OGATHE_004669 [Ogataea polymorpha]|uniref:Uncharacterized protein n=1 Tax=Ogataea polymorpha TaxID=460523 RepID=A0A9P8T1R4_9ASCO|nr:hypothetical protein OGATHE_004669 [Ogataea polymorpha]